MAAATPTNLKLSPGVESLVATWSMSGENLGGWLLHFRAKGSTNWTTAELKSTVRSYAITGLQAVAYEVQLRALVAGGLAAANATPQSKPVEPPPIEPPHKEEPEPSKGTVSNACLPGVCVNGGGTFAQAVQAGLKGGVGRESGSMSSLASQALGAGMQVDFLLPSGLPTVGGAISEYQALSTALKPAVRCIEVGNESWPGGVNGSVNGKQYGECFVKAAAEAKAKGLTIPLLCQVRIAQGLGDSWLAELVAVPGMKTALIGLGTESAPQHMLASHPYYASMMVAPKEPTNLANRLDTNGNAWGGNGWMKEQAYILQKLGLLCSVAITEYGARFTGALGSDDSVGSQAAQGVIGRDCMAFLKLVKEGKVPSSWLPMPGYTPAVDFLAWYSLFGNAKSSATETFGLKFYSAEGGNNEPLYGEYKAGAEALVASPAREQP